MRRAGPTIAAAAAGLAVALASRLLGGPHLLSLLLGLEVALAASALLDEPVGRRRRAALLGLGAALPLATLLLLAREGGTTLAVAVGLPVAGFLALGHGLGALACPERRRALRPTLALALALGTGLLAFAAIRPLEIPGLAGLGFALFFAGLAAPALPAGPRAAALAAGLSPVALVLATFVLASHLPPGLALGRAELQLVAVALFFAGGAEARAALSASAPSPSPAP